MVFLLYFAEFCIGLPFQKDCFEIQNPFWMMVNCKNGFRYSMNVINPPTSIENFQIGKSVFQPYGSIPNFLEKTTESSILPPLRPNSANFEGRHTYFHQSEPKGIILSVQPMVVFIWSIFITAVIDHMTSYNLTWPCALDHILKR